MENRNKKIKSILSSLDAGFILVPVPEGRKGPILKGWTKNSRVWITNEEQVIAYIGQYPNGGIGLLHGPSKTATLDIDHMDKSKMAFAAVGIDLDEILSKNGPKVLSRRGEKPIYRMPEGVELKTKKLIGTESVFELRGGHGVQDILPPSIHPETQKMYSWVGEPPKSPEDVPIIPEDILRIWINWEEEESVMRQILKSDEGVHIDEKNEFSKKEYKSRKLSANTGLINGRDRREKYALGALYGENGELVKLASSVEGGRNNQLNSSAYVLGQLIGAGVLDQTVVLYELKEIALKIGLSEKEIDKSLISGMEAGVKNPRDLSFLDKISYRDREIRKSVVDVQKTGKISVLENDIKKTAHQSLLGKIVSDEHALVRAAIAKQEKLPQKILLDLAADSDIFVQLAVTENPKLSGEIVNILLKYTTDKEKIAAAILSRDRISVQVIDSLSKYEHLRETILQRPEFDNIDTLQQLSIDTVKSLLNTDKIPCHIVTQALSYPNPQIQKLAIDIRELSEKLKERDSNINNEEIYKLAHNGDSSIRAHVALCEELPDDLALRLSKDRKLVVREALTKRMNMSPQLMSVLAQDPSDSVRISIAEHPLLTSQLSEQLAHSVHELVRHAIANRKDLSVKVIEKLVNDTSTLVKEAVLISIDNMDKNVVKRFDPKTIYFLSTQEHLSEKMASQIANYPVPEIRVEIAKSQYSSLKIVNKLVNDPELMVKLALTKRSDLNEDSMKILASDDNVEVRRELVKEQAQRLPNAVIRQLANDQDFIVRGRVLRVNDLSMDIVDQLSRDENPKIRLFFLKEREINLDQIRRFASDKSIFVVAAVSRHPDLPKDLMRELAKTDDVRIRVALADNPNLSHDVMLKLSQDREKDVQMALMKNSQITQAALINLSESPIYEIKRALTENAIVLESREFLDRVLKCLDNNERAKLVIESIPSLRPELISKLVKHDSDEIIRLSVLKNIERNLELQKTPSRLSGIIKDIIKHSEDLTVLKSVVDNAIYDLDIAGQMLEKVAQSDVAKDQGLLFEIAKNPVVLKSFVLAANFSIEQIRGCVQISENLPERERGILLIKALSHRSMEVQKLALEQMDVPRELVDKIVKDASLEIRETISILESEKISNETLMILSQDSSRDIRINIASRVDLPIDLQSYISRDNSIDVVMALAKNPILSEETAQKLLDHQNPEVRVAVVGRTDFMSRGFVKIDLEMHENQVKQYDNAVSGNIKQITIN